MSGLYLTTVSGLTGDYTIPQWIRGDSIDEDHSEGEDDIGEVDLGYNDNLSDVTVTEVWNSLERDVGSVLLMLMEQDYKISVYQSLGGFL